MILINRGYSFKKSSTYNNYLVNPELNNKVNNTKALLDENQKIWNRNKELINDYRYIHNSNRTKSISNITPISRSFFKLIEMIYELQLINGKSIHTCSIGAGPGGFIDCILKYSKDKDINILCYGITLLSNSSKVPHWNNILRNKDNIHLLDGYDGTGNICNIYNQFSFIKTMKDKIDFVTCDGAIDYSDNYNNQETNSYELLYSEIFLLLNIQKNGGNSTIKFFDLQYIKTIQLIYILVISYESVKIYKPNMSRISNSEKYIICKNYKHNKDITNYMLHMWDNKQDLALHIPDEFISDINNYNNLHCNTLIQSITSVIQNTIHRKKNEVLIENSIQWCNKYNIPINYKCIYLKDKENSYH